MNLGLKRGTVELSDFSDNWEQLFLDEKSKLLIFLKEFNIDIQHIGSTAIPHISAKPIIDILIGTENVLQINCIEEILIANQYLKCPISPKGDTLFAKGTNYYRTHYIHLIVKGTALWFRYVTFRDYLKSNPNIAQEYCNLKKDLANKYINDRVTYTEAKNDFIESIMKKIREINSLKI